MNPSEVKKLNEQVIETWNKHDVPAFLALCDENIVWKDIANPAGYKGKQGAKEFFSNWLTAFPDLKIKIVNILTVEDQAAVEIEFTGTNTGILKVGPDNPEIPATRKKVSNQGTYFARIKNGKFIEVRTYPDLAGMMMQLGLMHEMHA